jgi:hypothetical protein
MRSPFVKPQLPCGRDPSLACPTRSRLRAGPKQPYLPRPGLCRQLKLECRLKKRETGNGWARIYWRLFPASDFVTESAEHEVWYARADAMITDVIEASFEHGWRWDPTSMRHSVLKTSIVGVFDKETLSWIWGNAGCHHKSKCWSILTLKIDALL